MNVLEKFEVYKKMRRIFDQKDESGFTSTHEIGIDYTMTEKGLFLPAETTVMYQLLSDALKSGFMNPSQPFVDAGSGDARVNHIAALLGMRISIGIEYADDIVEKSRAQTKEFEDAGIIPAGRVILLQGDFTDPATYTQHGIDIHNIGTFFNYVNGWKGLLDFISTHGAVGTKLILIDEQYNVSSSIIEAIGAHPTLSITDTIKYVYDAKQDIAECLTDERLRKLQKIDAELTTQHMHLDASHAGQFAITKTDYRVVMVYLCEKIS
jgi:hypothetical protein